MDVFFINLADQIERRKSVERTFQANNRLQWRLHRIEAVTASAVAGIGVAGPIRDAEKACFLSHVKAITDSKPFGGHAFIAEDDIQFGEQSFQTIDALLATLPDNGWDIVYTDIIFPDAHAMIDCFLQRRRDGARPALVNLREARFAGSTAYIVNANAKDRVLNLLAQEPSLERPYDLNLRRLIRGDLLRAFLIFPFPTTVSVWGGELQIQPGDSDAAEFIWNGFRQLMWAERDVDQALAAAERIFADVKDDETEAFSRLLAGMLAPGYKRKRI